MSKAFTRESDLPEPPAPSRRAFLHGGARNYLTARGAEHLRNELAQIENSLRPKLVAAGLEDPEVRRDLQQLDQRAGELRESLASAVISDPSAVPTDQVGFGATVTIRDDQAEESVYRIVGVDETDLGPNHISWISPLAKALLRSRLGETVTLQLPSGKRAYQVTRIVYE